MPSLLPGEDDTIAALSTAAGRGAIAVVRLSGPSAFLVAKEIVIPWPLQARQATLCRIQDPNDGSLIDRCVISAFPAPHSYTGEDTVEFSTHGGHTVPAALLDALTRAGAREARPGEFTRRALLNGKLDLVQAEAVGDLIDATSDSMRRLSLHQLDGGLSHRIDELRNTLLDLEALLAYDIDFPEEDHGPISRDRITNTAAGIQNILQSLLDTAPATQLIRDGAIVVIAGRPNVGKSSLFNAIVGERRAIVTDIPGTTRDAIEARVELQTWPARLIDTAGLRQTDELVERLGIEVSERYLGSAHVIIACDDDASALEATIKSISVVGSAPIVGVLTKADREIDDGIPISSQMPSSSKTYLRVSAHTGAGLGQLTREIGRVLESKYGTVPVTRPALTRTRHRLAIEQAASELKAFQEQWQLGVLPTPVVAVHIRSAVGALDELIGAVDTEDVLSRLFATFCIGK